MQHSREEAEVTRLEQRHIQSEETGSNGESNHELTYVAERFCGDLGISPETSNDDEQI